MKKIKKKYLKSALAAVGLIAIAWVLSLAKSNPSSSPSISSSEVRETAPSTESLELAMVGDMLPHETITNAAKTGNGYNYLNLISPELQDAFKKADLRFCNQEAVSAGNLPVSGYPAFNAPVEFARDLSGLGCNLISTANNHAADKGLAGITGTLQAWDKLKPLVISGMYRDVGEAEKINIIEKNGIKIGFTAFNEVNNNSLPASETGINMLSDYKLLDQQVKGLKEKADVVIVSVHWGAEDSHALTLSQKKYAQTIADLGADIIIGTGPHVWQPYQELARAVGGKTYLWNSIGNGLNSQTKQDQLFSGIALLNISKDEQGKITISSPRVLPTYMHYVWGGSVGLSQSQLLARKDLKWTLLTGSKQLIDQRNDFKATELEQINKLKSYLANEQVKILNSH